MNVVSYCLLSIMLTVGIFYLIDSIRDKKCSENTSKESGQ